MEGTERHTFESLDCIDMLGVTDHCFVNDKDLSCERVKSSLIGLFITDSCKQFRLFSGNCQHVTNH